MSPSFPLWLDVATVIRIKQGQLNENTVKHKIQVTQNKRGDLSDCLLSCFVALLCTSGCGHCFVLSLGTTE